MILTAATEWPALSPLDMILTGAADDATAAREAIRQFARDFDWTGYDADPEIAAYAATLDTVREIPEEDLDAAAVRQLRGDLEASAERRAEPSYLARALATLAEREACAKIADDGSDAIARAIRARGAR